MSKELNIDLNEKIDIDEVAKGLNLPWNPKLDKYHGQVIEANDGTIAVSGIPTDEALYLTRAVNLFPELVKCLKSAIPELEWIRDDEFCDKIEKLIQKAEGVNEFETERSL